MYLFFNVQAIGMPKKWSAPHTDTFNWPRLLSISWRVMDDKRKVTEAEDFIILQDGAEIPVNTEQITGITMERVKEEGKDLKTVLEAFAKVVKDARYVVAHNMNYCSKVVGAEMVRKSVPSVLFHSDNYCIMMESTYHCKLPGKQGKYKWPTMKELYAVLFKEQLPTANRTDVAVETTALCFFKLLDIEAMELF